ncbi:MULTISPECIES: hypothetical protein [unclassified Serratia (in: enterobacteria)]|uniref:hypothetical protein n=1 Tax=unclassified Serratia (in: enterobacteria) TaxID=2647522 RepID=UPI001CC0E102|nr:MULTISPECIES: hypothetical protein [unclassified Serratia (in: enterobacteria)]UAN56702.1 hypothetical protein KGP21_24300 [Serratia sp. JSRIV004]UAN62298.1 hypothetical protein KGP16_22495 [Serratia sp. JSRIV006]
MFRFGLMTGSVKNYLMYYIFHSFHGCVTNNKQNIGRNKSLSTDTYCHFSVVLFLLGISPMGIASSPWTYQCSIESNMSTYTSSWYNTVDPTHFDFRLLASTREMTAIDNHGLENNALIRNVEVLKNSLYDLIQVQFINASATATVYGSALYGDEHTFTGYGVQPPESTNSNLINYILNCSGYTHCITILTPVNGVLSFQINNKLSFSSAFSTPQLSISLNLPEGPKNEYQSHSMTFTDTLLAIGYGISSPVGINLGSGSYYSAPSQVYPFRITCNREATPLTVTLNDGSPVISFGTVLLRQDTVVRPLTWKTSGSGQADIWTLTYDSPTKTGDTLLLGDVMITIKDELGNIIPLGTPVTIRGTSGEHTLSLDPKTDMTGLQSTNLSVTLTAN